MPLDAFTTPDDLNQPAVRGGYKPIPVTIDPQTFALVKQIINIGIAAGPPPFAIPPVVAYDIATKALRSKP
jgi:hypothetical protein